MKKTTIFTAVLLISGMAAAQPTGNSTADGKPGWIGPGHPLYGLEVAYENTVSGTPIGPKPAKLASERASELKIASEKDLNKSLGIANKSLNRVAEVAQGNSTGLQQARQILSTIENRTPEAGKGLSNAIGNIDKAIQRGVPESKSRGR